MRATVLSFILSILFSLSCSSNNDPDSSQDLSQVTRTKIDMLDLFLSVENDSLQRPNYLDLLPDGKLVLLDTRRLKVHIYSPDGKSEVTFGRPGKGPGEFVAPRGLYVNDSIINLIDVGLLRVNQFNRDGSFIQNYPIESNYFGYKVTGPATDYYAVANGKDGKLIQYRNVDTDSVYYFGEAIAENPPPVTDTKSFYNSAANGEIPEAIQNDVMMDLNGEDLYVFLKAFSRLQKYTDGELQWDRKIALPVNEVIFNRFVKKVRESKSGFGVLRYISDITATSHNVYLLWDNQPEYPQQIVQISSKGDMERIFSLPEIERVSFSSISIDEERNRFYLSAPRAAEVYIAESPVE